MSIKLKITAYAVAAVAIGGASVAVASPSHAAVQQHNYCIWRYGTTGWDSAIRAEVAAWSGSPNINVYLHSDGCPTKRTSFSITVINNMNPAHIGEADIGGPQAWLNGHWTWRATEAQKRTTVGHEMGHMFGFEHMNGNIMSPGSWNYLYPNWYLLSHVH